MKEISLIDVLINMGRSLLYPNQTRKTLFGCSIISLIGACFIPQNCSNRWIDILVPLAGFEIACIAIIMSMSKESLAMLNQGIHTDHCECIAPFYKKLSNGRYIDDLAASISFGIILSITGVIFSLFNGEWIARIIIFIVCFSLLWLIHIALHLFSLRSILCNKRQ